MPLFTDEKILTAWNGLMLMALSRAAGAFSDRRYLMEAEALADFMADKLYDGGRLKLTQRANPETHSIYIESEAAQMCVPRMPQYMFISTVTV